jgi:WD40 repeat protein
MGQFDCIDTLSDSDLRHFRRAFLYDDEFSDARRKIFYYASWNLAKERRKGWRVGTRSRIRQNVNMLDMLHEGAAMNRQVVPILPKEIWEKIFHYNKATELAKATELEWTVEPSRRGETTSIAFSPSDDVLASGGSDGTIKLWNFDTRHLIKKLQPGCRDDVEDLKYGVCTVAFSPSGSVLASGGYGFKIKLWNVETGELIKTLEGHMELVTSLVFHPSGDVLASASPFDDTQIKLWNVQTGQLIWGLDIGNGCNSLSISPSGALLASGSTFEYGRRPKGNKILLWNVQTGELIKSFDRTKHSVETLCFHPSGDVLASGGSDKTIKLWKVETGELIKTLEGHLQDIQSLSFHPSGDVLASGSLDETTKLWNVETGELIKTIPSDDCEVAEVSFSPSGDVLAICRGIKIDFYGV